MVCITSTSRLSPLVTTVGKTTRNCAGNHHLELCNRRGELEAPPRPVSPREQHRSARPLETLLGSTMWCFVAAGGESASHAHPAPHRGSPPSAKPRRFVLGRTIWSFVTAGESWKQLHIPSLTIGHNGRQDHAESLWVHHVELCDRWGEPAAPPHHISTRGSQRSARPRHTVLGSSIWSFVTAGESWKRIHPPPLPAGHNGLQDHSKLC